MLPVAQFNGTHLFEFSIRNSSLISKVKSRKLAGALDCCFVLFETLQQCAPMEPGVNRTRDLTVKKPVSNCCATSVPASFRLSALLINDEFQIENSNQIPNYLHLFEFTFR